MSERRTDAVAAYAMLRTALLACEATPAELAPPELDEIRRQVERQLAIEDAVLASETAGEVAVSDAEVATAMRELQSRYPDREEFLNDLARNGLDRRGLKKALARELKVTAVLARVGEMAPAVTDEEVREYYDAHRQQFDSPETREARHILITVNDEFPENSRDAALERIRKIEQNIDKKPERFGEAAAGNSECPTAMQEGRLGRIRPGQLYPELDAALFAMAEGEISGPIETEIGFHLLCCDRIHPAGAIVFEEAAAKIREQLQQRRGDRYRQAWLASLTSRHC